MWRAGLQKDKRVKTIAQTYLQIQSKEEFLEHVQIREKRQCLTTTQLCGKLNIQKRLKAAQAVRAECSSHTKSVRFGICP